MLLSRIEILGFNHKTYILTNMCFNNKFGIPHSCLSLKTDSKPAYTLIIKVLDKMNNNVGNHW